MTECECILLCKASEQFAKLETNRYTEPFMTEYSHDYALGVTYYARVLASPIPTITNYPISCRCQLSSALSQNVGYTATFEFAM